MKRIILCSVLLVLPLIASAQTTSPPPLCPDTHYPCGTDSCCSR